jgi:uncharacterized membrane protein YqaE (UPF0057 family)
MRRAGPRRPGAACTIGALFAHRTAAMRLLIAIFLPFLAFFTIGRPIAGVICLILQLTLIGWLPAAIWAVYALSQYKTDKKIDRAMRSRQP